MTLKSFTGWQRQQEQLEAIKQIDGWISPRLGVRFQLSDKGLEMFDPSRSQALESRLREMGIDPNQL
ncbi:MAG: hypothetical protein ACM65K_05245 [Microcoleus sp.]